MSLSRAENTHSAATQSVNLVELARELAIEHAPRALAANQDIDFAVASPIILARCDPLLTTEIISNLLDNAIRYAGPAATITVTIAEADEYIVLSVSDDGRGVGGEQRQRLTERFYRAGADRDSSGSGLGLSIAKRLAQAMDGRLSIDADGIGVTVSLLLPPVYSDQDADHG